MKTNLTNPVAARRGYSIAYAGKIVAIRFATTLLLFSCLQAAMAAANLAAALELEPRVLRAFVLKESEINRHHKLINVRQDSVIGLFNAFDAALMADEQSSVQNISRALIVALRHLQESLIKQDVRLERYRLFVYSYLSNARQKPSQEPFYVAAQQINPQWQAIAESLSAAMLPKDKAAIAPSIKLLLNTKKEVQAMDEMRASIARSPYGNTAGLMDRHDKIVFERVLISIKIAICAQLRLLITQVIDLHINEELALGAFHHEGASHLRHALNSVPLELLTVAPVENLYPKIFIRKSLSENLYPVPARPTQQ